MSNTPDNEARLKVIRATACAAPYCAVLEHGDVKYLLALIDGLREENNLALACATEAQEIAFSVKRRLAKCREALDEIANGNGCISYLDGCDWHCKDAARAALAATQDEEPGT